MNLDIPESLFNSIQTILKYQNTLLLKEIAKDKGWKLSELKKEYLKSEDISVLVKKYNKKKKKVIKNKKSENEKQLETPEETQVLEKEVSNEVIELDDVNIPIETPSVVEEKQIEPSNTVDIPEPEKKVKKKKIKKIVKNVEIKCHKYTIEDTVFYVNVENNNAYDKNMEFVGRMQGKSINFNEDEV